MLRGRAAGGSNEAFQRDEAIQTLTGDAAHLWLPDATARRFLVSVAQTSEDGVAKAAGERGKTALDRLRGLLSSLPTLQRETHAPWRR
jgi:hypothetical protein